MVILRIVLGCLIGGGIGFFIGELMGLDQAISSYYTMYIGILLSALFGLLIEINRLIHVILDEKKQKSTGISVK